LTILDLAAHIADMKHIDYENTLAVACLLELLCEKGFLSKEEFAAKALDMDQASLAEILLKRRSTL